MKAIICDMCGAVIDHATRIAVEPMWILQQYTWTDGGVKGEYCDDCFKRIQQAIKEVRREINLAE